MTISCAVLRASVLLARFDFFLYQHCIWEANQLTTFFIYLRNTDFNIEDFSSNENATGTIKFSSKSTGQTYSGTYALGERIAGDSFGAAIFDVTLDSGDVLSGLVSTSDCEGCAGPVVKYMYMGFGDDSTTSWDDAMGSSEQEWFLMACLDADDPNGSKHCDFSSADPGSALKRMRSSVRSRLVSKK